jgi:hypothetical protein
MGDRTMTSIIKVDQIQTAAGAAPTAAGLGLNVSGSVLQVVTGSFGSEVSLTGTNIYLGVQASFTPFSVDSKIFAIASIQCATSGTGRMQFFFRSSTESGNNVGTVQGDMYVGQPNAASTSNLMSASLTALFTAGTTSPVYVKLCSTKHDGGTGYINKIGAETRITIMEIAV